MRLSDKELKRILQEAAEYDADCIIAEVESAPEMQDVIAPDDIYDNVLKMIREHESRKESPSCSLTDEQQELIRLGLKYKKNSGKGKYFILVAAIVCALGVGTISFGDGEKVVQKVKDMVAGKEQIHIDDDEGLTKELKAVSEDDAYEKVDEAFGFYPVKLLYLPKDMKFTEIVVEEASQNARLYYDDMNGRSIIYRIITNHRTGSVGVDIEDVPIQEYNREVKDVLFNIKEYKVKENNATRWMVSFTYDNTHYSLIITGIEQTEMEKIIENLYFA